MRLTEKVQELLSAHLMPGDIAIDATAGNGHDTLGLCQRVGPTGEVIAIDIQSAALETTRERLSQELNYVNYQLRLGDHSQELRALEANYTARVQTITFNLGYLPGSDKAVQTTSETTLPALNSARQLIQTAGHLMVTAYRGHAGGLYEANAVGDWFEKLESAQWTIAVYEPQVQSKRIPPILYHALRKHA